MFVPVLPPGCAGCPDRPPQHRWPSASAGKCPHRSDSVPPERGCQRRTWARKSDTPSQTSGPKPAPPYSWWRASPDASSSAGRKHQHAEMESYFNDYAFIHTWISIKRPTALTWACNHFIRVSRISCCWAAESDPCLQNTQCLTPYIDILCTF